MFRLWKAYQTALTVHPTRTSMLTTGLLMSAGDALAQTVVERKSASQYDLMRTGRFLVFGTFLGGPMFSMWYRHLAKTFEGKKYAQVKMVACDQLGFAPPFLAFFLTSMEVMKGQSFKDIKSKMKQDYLEVLKTNYKIWPAVQAINFTFVPLHLRIVTVNIVAIFWNTYLAFISGRSPTEELLEEQLHTD